MIEIFRTSIDTAIKADHVINILEMHFEFRCVSVDIDDCDHVLRIENDMIPKDDVITTLQELDIHCEELPD
jgi:hypothetical protein